MRKDIEKVISQIPVKEIGLVNKSELARRYNCDPRTVDRHLKIQSGAVSPSKSKRIYKSVLDGYKEIIREKVDLHGASAKAVFKFIKKKGYPGEYSTVAGYVREHKCNEIRKATVRFETTPGLQAQVDWKENITMINKEGEKIKVNIFLMVLGYSRVKYVELTENRSQKTLLKCMINAFKYFGGIPQEILFDNMKTVVDRSKTSFYELKINKNFKYFSEDVGFKPILCRPYRPQTKGKVESLAKLTNRLVVYNGEFKDYDEFKEIVALFNEEINNEISQAINSKPVNRLEKEKEYLKPLPTMDILLSHISRPREYKVTKESMISYKGKKYSVQTKCIGKHVTIEVLNESELCIYYNGDCVGCHPITDKKIHYSYDHYHEILKSDALKKATDSEIDAFIENNMSLMDIYLGE